jgi:electron transfer flavoprotein beta subunit
VKIAVCIKRVPDMEQRFKIAASGAQVDEAGLKYTMSDFDEWAVEAALQLVEKHGGDVTVVSLGPDSVQEIIRKALAMGAERGVQLKTDAAPFDGFATARALAAELQGGGYDLVLFGKLAVDTSAGVTGPMVAELLGLPCVTAASKLELANGRGRAERALESAVEVVEFPLPAVVTVDQGLVAQARYPALKGIMAAKKKPLEVKPAQVGEQTVTITKMELPAERAAGRIIGEGAAAVPELVRLLREEAKVL